MKKVNVAKGKTLNNVQDFAKIFTTLTIDQKTAVLKNIGKCLESKVGMDNKIMTPGQILTLAGLNAWCLVNIMVGEELCPASNLSSYIKTKI